MHFCRCPYCAELFQKEPEVAPQGGVAGRGKFHHFVYVRATPDVFQYCTFDSDFRTRDAGWFRKGDEVDSLFSDGACPF